MVQHQGLACGYHARKDARASSRSEWDEISNLCNSLGPPLRLTAEWKRVWADMKQNIKKKLRKDQTHRKGTGGGPYIPLNLTPTEDTVVALCSLDTAIEGASVKKFGAPINDKMEVNFEISQLSPSHSISSTEILLEEFQFTEMENSQQIITTTQVHSAPHTETAITHPEMTKQTATGPTRKRSTKQSRERLLKNQIDGQNIFNEQLLDCLQENLKINQDILRQNIKFNDEIINLKKLKRLDSLKQHKDRIELDLKFLDVKLKQLSK